MGLQPIYDRRILVGYIIPYLRLHSESSNCGFFSKKLVCSFDDKYVITDLNNTFICILLLDFCLQWKQNRPMNGMDQPTCILMYLLLLANILVVTDCQNINQNGSIITHLLNQNCIFLYLSHTYMPVTVTGFFFCYAYI